jgi:glutamyl-tRNA synthetase
MISTTVDGAVLRLKGDMCCENTAMRDPTLFRIIENEHPLQGTKYRVWPTYDFAGAIEDSLSGVTHPFRTKEYELRDECYFRLLDLLNLRKPHLMEFARLSIEGMPVSKRKIKHLIDKHLIKGYDDIRLPTLRGLKKRGIQPEAIRQFVFSQGISKVESTVSFSILESFNRKLLDTKVKRYFFVKDPVQLYVVNAPMKEKILNFHPLNEKLGTRTILTKNNFFIPAEDIELLYPDDVFRLKDLFNVKIIEKNKTVKGIYIGDDILPETKKIQWTTEQYIPMKIFIPKPLFKNAIFDTQSLETVNGYAEHAVSSLKTGDIIQFERFGFVKIERTNEMIKGILTHK